jgi:ribosome-associated protein
MAGKLDIEELRPWIEERFARSGGPGGQHVNKTSTQVQLLFDVDGCDAFTETEKRRIRRRLENRIARDGRLRVTSQAERSQARNREAAEARLLQLLRQALHVPKRRKPTKPTAGSRERRLRAKRERGETKRLRQKPPRAE